MGFQKQQGKSAFFEILKTFIVRVGEWVGGDQKGPSILLKIKYNNKQGALIPNLASKVVYGHYVKSYEQIESENVKF